MRIGINPQKKKKQKIKYKRHRIIIPVYIPDDSNEYFRELFKVFSYSLHSILNTIDTENTAITILNNNSKNEVSTFIEKLLLERKIDKHVKYSENKGKVYSVLQEARSCYEDYVTITDADVFFFPGWQAKVHEVFSVFKNVGVVGLTPDPHMTYYYNISLFFSNLFSIKHGKVVDDKYFEMFEKGINNREIFISKRKNWKKNQFYLQKGDVSVVIGASHFASTYRSEVFRKIDFQKPIFVFPGGEKNFIDSPIDRVGYGRVSLTKAFVYHMGNTIPKWLVLHMDSSSKLIINELNNKKWPSFVPYGIKKIIVRIVIKFFF